MQLKVFLISPPAVRTGPNLPVFPYPIYSSNVEAQAVPDNLEPDETEAEALLRRYNPVLVLLPHDITLAQPWSSLLRGTNKPRGDYHPCTAEFFLSHVLQRPQRRPWRWWQRSERARGDALGLSALRALIAGSASSAIGAWELDIAEIPSQNAAKAWRVYGEMLERQPWEQPAYVYARYVPGPPAVLEYWYLYIYNDAPNRHEGDWEMVAIELDEQNRPSRAGYASHSHGYRRDWERVETRDGRPIVYVARGSHAAYFQHYPDGHRGPFLRSPKGLPAPMELIWNLTNTTLQAIAVRLRFKDYTVAIPDETDPSGDRGVLIDPTLIVFPPDATDDPDFWWMSLDCRWGSRHARITGTIGPNPPWRQTNKWRRPSQWIDSLDPD